MRHRLDDMRLDRVDVCAEAGCDFLVLNAVVVSLTGFQPQLARRISAR